MRHTGTASRLLTSTLLTVFIASCGGDDKKSADGTTTTSEATTTTATPSTSAATAASTTAPAAAATTTTKAKPATTTTTAPAKLSATQFFIAKPGCKNEIDFVRVGADRKVVQSKAVVKAAGDTQLIAYSERDDRLLFGAYNCDTKSKTISEIALNDPRATPKLIASDLDVVDADYDYKSKAVLILTGVATDPEPAVVSIDSASGARTVRWRRPPAWKPANAFDSVYPSRLRALTGGEMMIGGDGGKKFVVARVSESGFTSGGVTGDGKLATFDISILQGSIAVSIDGSPDLYLCAFGQVYGANQPTPISSAPGCAANPLPAGLTSAGPDVAWAFAGQDGHNLLLAIKSQAYLLDVESQDLRSGSSPPQVFGRTTTDVPYAVYVVSVYVPDRDLSKTLPSVTV